MNSFENFQSATEKPKDICETNNYPIVNDQLQRRYDKISSDWNGKAYEGTRRDDLIPGLIEAAEIMDGQKIIEVMSGTANLSQQIEKTFPKNEYYALDFSRGMLNAAPEQINKVQASVIAMPFANKSFDRIFLRSALYDLPKRLQLKALQEINRILKDDGIFILQTYFTLEKTFNALNDIVNLKDLASGQYQDMGQEYPRHFAKASELEKWIREVNFSFEKLNEFEGVITYMETKEMSHLGKNIWADYMKRLPEEIKKQIQLRGEDDGTLTYVFPGAIYKLKKNN